jgi:hypothetical protein
MGTEATSTTLTLAGAGYLDRRWQLLLNFQNCNGDRLVVVLDVACDVLHEMLEYTATSCTANIG